MYGHYIQIHNDIFSLHLIYNRVQKFKTTQQKILHSLEFRNNSILENNKMDIQLLYNYYIPTDVGTLFSQRKSNFIA